ncbi:VF530 family DNA-binding protein [Aliiglaciecola sp. 3_MG-2023]|uniref:VF530 family protein n=1 Tax=Aliiglaciecola sp. 3_MG-2023 TaxID=3062644 RepID=UPI0034A34E21
MPIAPLLENKIKLDIKDNKPGQQGDPLHGITLKKMLEALHKEYGFEGLGWRIKVKCFIENPSMSSSLKFLRRTPWARKKVEELYLSTFCKK